MADQKPDEIQKLLDSLEVSPLEKATLSRALGAVDDAALLDRLKAVSLLSLREYVDWALARKRFSSLSELDTHRIIGLFLSVRKQSPTTEQLVEELAIPASRATSLLGRIRYGEGRLLRRLLYAETLSDVAARVAEAGANDDGMKSLLVSRQSFACLEDVAWAIVQDHSAQAMGGKYEGAEYPSFQQSGRYAAVVSASSRMWDLMIGFLEEKAPGAGGA